MRVSVPPLHVGVPLHAHGERNGYVGTSGLEARGTFSRARFLLMEGTPFPPPHNMSPEPSQKLHQVPSTLPGDPTQLSRKCIKM